MNKQLGNVGFAIYLSEDKLVYASKTNQAIDQAGIL